MYKILLKYNGNKQNMWESYGATTNSTSAFTEFETDDVTVLKAEIEKLDAQYGHENIRVIQDVTVSYAATIVETVSGVTEGTI